MWRAFCNLPNRRRTMRILTVIVLLMILVSATASCTGADIAAVDALYELLKSRPVAPLPKRPSRPIEAPSNGFWFKPGTDIEQLKQDYSECGEIGYLLKGQKQCMREKGYTWATY